jgi:hypothetical protein
MKRIVSASLVFVVLLFASCATTYAPQTVPGTKPVPAIYSFYEYMPLIKQIGDVKVIHDINSKSLILFKGEDLKLVDEMQKWIGATGPKSPVILIAGTNILPFISFSEEDEKKMSKEDRDRVEKLKEYSIYTVTVFKKTYVEDLTPLDLQTFNLMLDDSPGQNVQDNTPQQQQSPGKRSGNADRIKQKTN